MLTSSEESDNVLSSAGNVPSSMARIFSWNERVMSIPTREYSHPLGLSGAA